VISAPDIDLVYDVPMNFERENLGTKILTKLQLKPQKTPDWSKWSKSLSNVKNPTHTAKIGIVGKYLDIGDYKLLDVYLSIKEALVHAGARVGVKAEIEWIDSKEVEQAGTDILKDYKGIIVPGGFGTTGIEGKITTIKYLRENNIPFLGLCLGMQLAVVEYARNQLHLKGAHTREIDDDTPYPVVTLLPSQERAMQESEYGGTMRLGAYAACLKPGSLTCKLYKEQGRIKEDMAKSLAKERLGDLSKSQTSGSKQRPEYVLERHRHRFEISPDFEKGLEEKGLVFSGHHYRLDGVKLVEFLELPDHPFFVATQAHPEFKSRFLSPAPLFVGFLQAAKELS
jgi:CTP synthase